MSDRIENAEIQTLLPHRYPFLLIDAAEDYVAGTSIVGIKGVTANEPFFPGHFPGNPVMPGVLMIEAMAQAGAVLMYKTLGASPDSATVFFMGADKVRFRAPVRPGMMLRMPVAVTAARHGVFKFKGEVWADGKRAVQAEFSAKAIENK
ncbi:3-hydroxyacyl-[acyl-carrier-protein] dehydratase FabZ [Maricaulis sp. W15]|uniref:3-hydroxyacyl-[acyl-carrier-protein] dehydratase FabZ n=1 Tax=Maricaulis maris TaxID=74318 RepID=A0A495DJE0_9PROT|nr:MULTISPECIES: 3-hydroxyacyl-ACP dehydratase FabZ [Maricaulis]OLF77918.1 3-hydroxyacyl-[acyl-carrier-protein] dehydratase FabZ [Maricaulis sp. W15]RKR02749.1 3-hydroxyacyl-[acyl-carrier-protein] dehydratase [Maricaulis maris]